MVDINYIKSIIYPEQESVDKRIEPGDTLTDDIISILSNGKSENIKKCFKPLDKNLRGCKFHIITKCSMCGNEFTKDVTKDYLLNKILSKKKNKSYKICNECEEKEKIKQKDSHNKRAAELKQQKENFTQDIIQNYLLGNRQISFSELRSIINKSYDDQIAAYIQTMNYKDFLNSSYWKAIAKYRKYKADNKCCMCGSKEKLNVHHNTYKHHGYEHIYSFMMSDLTVLCNKCHEKFHFEINK